MKTLHSGAQKYLRVIFVLPDIAWTNENAVNKAFWNRTIPVFFIYFITIENPTLEF